MWFDGKFEKLQRQRILKWSPKIIEQNRFKRNKQKIRNESKHKLNTYQNGCDSNNRSKNSDSIQRSDHSLVKFVVLFVNNRIKSIQQ